MRTTLVIRLTLACLIFVSLALAVAGLTARATAFPMYYDAWVARYPTSTIPMRMETILGAGCFTCHLPTSFGDEGTCYRLDIRDRLHAGMTIEEALAAVEPLDSDGDGVSNLEEILEPRADMPGQVGYHPGLVGPMGRTPCGPIPNDPITNQLETPPCAADFNQDGLANSQDYFDFLTAFFAQSPAADFNHDGVVNSQDYFDFLTAFFAGCN
jgi:hypothetical protein